MLSAEVVHREPFGSPIRAEIPSIGWARRLGLRAILPRRTHGTTHALVGLDPSRPRPVHVLVVDDERDLSALLARALRRAFGTGWAPVIETAANDEEALALVRAVPADAPLIILSDYNLGSPRTGIQVLREAAALRPDARRVLMSGYATETFQDQLAETPLDAVLGKPLDIGDLRRLVASLVPGDG